jgi:plastocyanin
MRRVLVLAFAVLALAACSKQPPEVTAQQQVPADQRTAAASSEGAGGGGGGGGGDATWVAVDIDFESAPESLPAGEQEITLVNNGTATHNVTIDGELIVETEGGQTGTGTVNLEPGTYDYICSIPGHDASMNGSITVE